MRVTAFIDGFNLYHALDDTGLHHLKWVDLRRLCEAYISPGDVLTDVLYFSAYATWRPVEYGRHRAYVAALRTVGVTPIMGRFKEKDRQCRSCRARWKDHEEKETDVNIAVEMVHRAYAAPYDMALLISGDSDLSPAVRQARLTLPAVRIRVVAPLHRNFSMDLVNAAGGIHLGRRMRRRDIERALFPQVIRDGSGATVAIRPPKYDPPR